MSLHGGESSILNKTRHLPFELAIILFGIYPAMHFHKYNHCDKVSYCDVIYYKKILESTKMPSTVDMLNNLWHIYTGEYIQSKKEGRSSLWTDTQWFSGYIVDSKM